MKNSISRLANVTFAFALFTFSGSCLAQEQEWWWDGTFSATYKDGDLILEATVPKAPEMEWQAARMSMKIESLDGEFQTNIVGKPVTGNGTYYVFSNGPKMATISLNGTLINPKILELDTSYFKKRGVAIYQPLRLAEYFAQEFQGRKGRTCFVKSAFEADRLSRELSQNAAKRKAAQEAPIPLPNYIVAIGNEDYQRFKAGSVKKVEISDGQVTVEVGLNTRESTAINDPKLMMKARPTKRKRGFCLAEVPLTAESLPVGTRVILVATPQEAARINIKLYEYLQQKSDYDLPIELSPVFLVSPSKVNQ